MSKPTPMLFPMSTGLFSSTAQSSELISTPQARPKKGDPHFQNEAIGRSRGGLTTKIHLACDGHGRPLSVLLTGGDVNDNTMFEQVMAGVVWRRPGPGRPATRPHQVLADKGYSSKANRAYLRRRGIRA